MSRVLLITGCRSGIGEVTALEAGRRGYRVYAGLRDSSTGDDLIEETDGFDVRVLQLDITDDSQRKEAVERIMKECGRLDALVNNAGVALGGFLELVEEDELREVFDVNVFGTWAMTKACLPALRSSSGIVVNVSSMSGRMAFPGLGAYSASKFALEGMSEAWRHELGLVGVRLALVEPGAYRTDIWDRNRKLARRAAETDTPYGDRFRALEELFERAVGKIANNPTEVAEKILALVEDPSPPLRHPMGSESGIHDLLVRLLPFAAVEGILELAFKWMGRQKQ
jgi:NAD(P)-dependent dehydrogenase (short-subunit alcohol dehydrogenase family)